MRRWIGRWLMGVGALHTLIGIAVFAAPLRDIVDAGVVGTLGPRDTLRNLAFWFLFGGVTLVMIGYLTDWIERAASGLLPAPLGWALLATAVLGATLAPASGFWLVFPPAVGILLRARSAGESAAIPSPAKRHRG
jgi:hypothetical protein